MGAFWCYCPDGSPLFDWWCLDADSVARPAGRGTRRTVASPTRACHHKVVQTEPVIELRCAAHKTSLCTRLQPTRRRRRWWWRLCTSVLLLVLATKPLTSNSNVNGNGNSDDAMLRDDERGRSVLGRCVSLCRCRRQLAATSSYCYTHTRAREQRGRTLIPRADTILYVNS